MEQDYKVNIIRTNRKKSISISIESNIVKLRVPKELTNNKIRNLLENKKPWILEKLRMRRLIAPIKPKVYLNGEEFLYLGRRYFLRVNFGKESFIKLMGKYFDIIVPESEKEVDVKVKKLMASWYNHRARILLTQKTLLFSKDVGVWPKSIVVKNYKSKWGSCSTNGDICYNWRIVLAPSKIVDYLVIHELCHLLEHNHSQNFWRHVSNNCFHFKESRKWLKIHGRELII